MAKIAIMTDTNSGISVEEGRGMGLFVQPMPVMLGGRDYLEGVDVTHEDVYAAMRAKEDVATSQPAVGEVMATWDSILAQGYDGIVYIPMSSGLSGSCAAAAAVALDYDGKVEVADAKRISVTQRECVLDALADAAQGLTAAEIKARLEANGGESVIYLAVNTLEYLKKSGRVTPAAAAIAAVLNIKPVLCTLGGKFDNFAKVRGMQAARARILDAVRADLDGRFKGIPADRIHIATAGSFASPENAAAWQKQVQEAFPDKEVRYDPLSCSVCCHTGMDAAGLGLSVIAR